MKIQRKQQQSITQTSSEDVAKTVQDGELNIFVPTSGTLNKVQDKDIRTDMILANWDNTVVYIHDGRIWTVMMQ